MPASTDQHVMRMRASRGTGVFMPRTGRVSLTSANETESLANGRWCPQDQPQPTFRVESSPNIVPASPTASSVSSSSISAASSDTRRRPPARSLSAGSTPIKGFTDDFCNCMDSLEPLGGMSLMMNTARVHLVQQGRRSQLIALPLQRSTSVTGAIDCSRWSQMQGDILAPHRVPYADKEPLSSQRCQHNSTAPLPQLPPPPPPRAAAAAAAAAVKCPGVAASASGFASPASKTMQQLARAAVIAEFGPASSSNPADLNVPVISNPMTAWNTAMSGSSSSSSSRQPSLLGDDADVLLLGGSCSPTCRNSLFAAAQAAAAANSEAPAAVAVSSPDLAGLSYGCSPPAMVQVPDGKHDSDNSCSLFGSSPIVSSMGSSNVCALDSNFGTSKPAAASTYWQHQRLLLGKGCNIPAVSSYPDSCSPLQMPATAAGPAATAAAADDDEQQLQVIELELGQLLVMHQQISASTAALEAAGSTITVSNTGHSSGLSDTGLTLMSNCAGWGDTCMYGLEDATTTAAALHQQCTLLNNTGPTPAVILHPGHGTLGSHQQPAAAATTAHQFQLQQERLLMAASKLNQLATVQEMQRALQQELTQLLRA